MQIYTALSRVKASYDRLYCTGEFEKSAIKINKDALLEYEGLKRNDLFTTIKRSAFSGDTFTVLVQNVRSLSKHLDNIVPSNRVINNDMTETHYLQRHKIIRQILLGK